MTTNKVDVDQTSEPLAAGSEQATTATAQRLVPRTKKVPRLRFKTGLKAGGAGWE